MCLHERANPRCWNAGYSGGIPPRASIPGGRLCPGIWTDEFANATDPTREAPLWSSYATAIEIRRAETTFDENLTALAEAGANPVAA